MAKILGMIVIDNYKLVNHVLPSDSPIHDESEEKDISQAVIERYKYCSLNFRNQGLRSFMTKSQRGDK